MVGVIRARLTAGRIPLEDDIEVRILGTELYPHGVTAAPKLLDLMDLVRIQVGMPVKIEIDKERNVMTAENRCKNSVKNCSYCTTGFHKRPARRKERREAKKVLRAA